MKIIISRKGFDAQNGGTASPVMPDGTMISFPIPDGHGDVDYIDIGYRGLTLADIWMDLKPRQQSFNMYCHFDPDLRKDIHLVETPDNWKPAFGQADVAETHLENQGVTLGDIFMFFGWFRQTEEIDGYIRYKKDAKDAHMFFGYLQIGDIVRGKKVEKLSWHPHSKAYRPGYNNTIYVASDNLVIDGEDTGLPGAGTFRYSDELVLSMPGHPKSHWKLPDFFRDVTISYHNADSFTPEGYFQSVKKGQEFVVSESPLVTEWAKHIIVNNLDSY